MGTLKTDGNNIAEYDTCIYVSDNIFIYWLCVLLSDRFQVILPSQVSLALTLGL